MRKILATYRNGNYRVTLFDDGTKIKETKDDFFSAGFPDSIDLKITDHCENNCPMCHEKSSKAGKHGDLTHHVIDTFPSGMEVAIGGGNPLSHPDLIPFLKRSKKRNIIANITINVLDLKKNTALVEYLIRERLVYGVGVSCLSYDEYAVDFAISHPNVVLHLINGIFGIKDYRRIMGLPLKILILGYKYFGKGKTYYSPAVEKTMRDTKVILDEILRGFKVVSFDNLALDQLEVKEKLGERRFNEIYMGNDGAASMYVDLVREEFALSSSSEERFPLAGSLTDCFRALPRKN